MRQLFAAAMAVAAFLLCSCSKSITVGVIAGENESELAALKTTLLKNADDVKLIDLSYDSLEKAEKCQIIWYHRPDTNALTQSEIELGEKMKKYIENGGKLVLTMDAVRLLNAWGIEQQPVEAYTYDCIDDGFGRKLGFHAYRSHPLFDDMFGGAYPWHGKKDNTARILGFTGKNMPEAGGTKIIATQWEYIFNRPENKVIWQTPVGKGSVLAIGCCLYYGRENFHTAQLDYFTGNVVRWLSGAKSKSPERYWDYSPATVVKDSESSYKQLQAAEPVPAPKPQGYSLSREARKQYADLSTPHNMIVAWEGSGIDEIWTHPVMSLRDFSVALEIEGKIVSLSEFTPLFTIYPQAIVREYDLGSIKLRETISSDMDKSVAVVNYAWSGGKIDRIIADFKSNLRYMWPYDANALGSLYFNWSEQMNAVLVRDGGREFASLVGSNVKGELLKAEADAKTLMVCCSVSYPTSGKEAADIIFSAGSEGEEKVISAYEQTLQRPVAVLENATKHYEEYLAGITTVETPDPVFNEAFRWAQISSAQFMVETPGLGRGLMAGYASSRRGWGGGHRVSGRPGYAWYFGRDAVWAALAFDAMGDFESVRSTLKLLIDHQEIDGKIYHELTSSGFTHFDASDSTPLMVVLMAHYLRASGDTAFVKEYYPAVVKALEYCRSTDTDGDGLIEISNVGHGWLEGGSLFGSQTEFYLAGCWLAALEAAEQIAEVCGQTADAQSLKAEIKEVGKAVEAFWNEEGEYYNYGLGADDKYTDSFISLTAAPVYFSVLDKERARKMSYRYSSPRMTVDWGIRTTYEDEDYSEFGAYSPRHVWPLFTGWAALAEFKTGYYNQGFATLANDLKTYKSFSLGRIAEVINGDNYRNNGITTHQCWSETMAVLPLIEGMLGFAPDALSQSLSLSPALPADWNSFKVSNLSIGKAKAGFSMEREKAKVIYNLCSDAPLSLHFSPKLPALTKVKSVLVNGSEAEYQLRDVGAKVEISVDLKLEGEAVVEILCEGGAEALAVVYDHESMQASKGFRLMNQEVVDGKVIITVEGRPGSSNVLRIWTPEGIEERTVLMPESEKLYIENKIEL